MSSNAVNPCAGRYAGCTADPPDDRRMCASCRAVHSANAAKRRKARLNAALCTVCGARAVMVDGVPLTTCKTHREYYRARAAS